MIQFPAVLLIAALAGLTPASMGARAEGTVSVKATAKPGATWKSYSTRTLDSLPGFDPAKQDGPLNRFGGIASATTTATGFFRTEKIGERWHLIDPDGGRFFHVGVASVRRGESDNSAAALKAKFGTTESWAEATTRLLRDNGFNGTGAWSEDEALGAAPARTVYTRTWNFMSGYGGKRGGTRPEPGHTGYPDGCIFVFDPGFEEYCEERAKDLAASKEDPWLLGHFSDNEMPLDSGALDRFLRLSGNEHGRKAAELWLRERRANAAGGGGEAEAVTDAERNAFLEHVADRYFRIVSTAIRRHDPNHLYLGARFNGPSVRTPEVFRAAGRYADVMSVNYYNCWTPKPELMEMWERESGRPCIVSEFYVKGEDSGLANTSGAGWVVKTQKDRGLFYANYALGLIESKSCVGWHWFRYMDNDPAHANADLSNVDSNKGIVGVRYEPYAPLLEEMNRLNRRIHTLSRYFDGKAKPEKADGAVAAAAKKISGGTKPGPKKTAASAKPKLPPAPDGVAIEQDVAYLAADRKEKLDLYLPAGRAQDVRSPAVVIIHGGGWVGGDKAGKREFVTGTALAQAGYVCASVEYMKEEGRRWPTNLLDCKNGVRWLRANAERLKIDPERIGVIGGSAGGHLALMTAYTSGVDGLTPESLYPGVSDAVQACVDMYGIANLMTRRSTGQDGTPTGTLRGASALFQESREANPELWNRASPTHYVSKTSPPTLIIHGTGDTTVDRDQSKELAALLARHGVDHELLLVAGAPHAFPLNDKRLPRDLRPEVIAFFDKHLKAR